MRTLIIFHYSQTHKSIQGPIHLTEGQRGVLALKESKINLGLEPSLYDKPPKFIKSNQI